MYFLAEINQNTHSEKKSSQRLFLKMFQLIHKIGLWSKSRSSRRLILWISPLPSRFGRRPLSLSLYAPKSASVLSFLLEGYLNTNSRQRMAAGKGPFCGQVVTLLLTANENTSLYAVSKKMGASGKILHVWILQNGGLWVLRHQVCVNKSEKQRSPHLLLVGKRKFSPWSTQAGITNTKSCIITSETSPPKAFSKWIKQRAYKIDPNLSEKKGFQKFPRVVLVLIDWSRDCMATIVMVWASSWAFWSGLWTETRAFQVQAFQTFWAFPLKNF